MCFCWGSEGPKKKKIIPTFQSSRRDGTVSAASEHQIRLEKPSGDGPSRLPSLPWKSITGWWFQPL